MVGQHVPQPTEATEQAPLTPTAAAAVDIKNTAPFNDRAMDDNDETWATEADHRTGWTKTFKSGTYRGMLHGVVLRDYPKQVVSLAKTKKTLQSCMSFSWAQRHDRIDVTASTVEHRTGGPTSAGAMSRWMQRVPPQRFECASYQVNVQGLWYRAKGRTSSAATRYNYMFSSTHGPQEEQRTHAKDELCRLWN